MRQKDFAKVLGKVLHRPAFMPAPAFALKVVLGGFSTELLSSKRVHPRKTQDAGFRFQFSELHDALASVLG
jgi:NAD dependent epimerase/dehydratase family enzyme